jgi:hypothetical protein
MVERHPYTVDTGVQFSNEVPVYSECSLVWLKAPALGAGDREFESHRSDHLRI